MNDLQEHGKILGISQLYFWTAFGMLFMSSLVALWLKPAFLGFEREAFVESHQYVEAHKDSLLTNIEEYDELEAEIAKYEQDEANEKIVAGLRAQQKSLKKRIRASLAKIPQEHHPADVERFSR